MRKMKWTTKWLKEKSTRVIVSLSAFYFVGIAVIMAVHLRVPRAAGHAQQLKASVNLTDAWQDLQTISSEFHPFNSRRNDQVHDWLITRIKSIIVSNGATWTLTHASDVILANTAAVIFDDNISNLTFSSAYNHMLPANISIYYESTNIIVYIRGSLDDPGSWWNLDEKEINHNHDGGVLINAHYDSVSTGFGATDDGVGVVSILQIINHFLHKDNTPQRGIVCLLNNGEEDFLNGAHVFTQHPMAKFAKTFLNLEGAGAGGRAILFRSTDAAVTKAYASSPHPFGSVISDDGFAMGLIRSQTDYIVFDGVLGMRGLDVAFWQPRARYHTTQDDAAHTSPGSIWHMLSASLSTMKSLTSQDSLVSHTQRERGVWFDILGSLFVVMKLSTLKSVSILLLIALPVLALVVHFVHLQDNIKQICAPNCADLLFRIGEQVLILAVPPAMTSASALLIHRNNPMIAYSSQYFVWFEFASSYIFFTWLVTSFGSHIFPTAYKTGFSWLSLFIVMWILLLCSIIIETKSNISGLYFITIYYAVIGFATILSSVAYYRNVNSKIRLNSSETTPLLHISPELEEIEPASAQEQAQLFSGFLSLFSWSKLKSFPQVFKSGAGQVVSEDSDSNQTRSGTSSMLDDPWFIQMAVVLCFVSLTLLPIGLIISTAMDQTGADGNSTKGVYLFMAGFSWLIFAPSAPYLHHLRGRLPLALLAILSITMVYNLTAFPFSADNRLKVYFSQQLDLDTGVNTVNYHSIRPYVRKVVDTLPSSSKKVITCDEINAESKRPGLSQCSYEGLHPLAVQGEYWLNYSATRLGPNSVDFKVSGKNTRSCRIYLDKAASFVEVEKSSMNSKFPTGQYGSKQIRLWSRTWENVWSVRVTWNQTDSSGKNVTGRVSCNWSDANKRGVIPAFDEAIEKFPKWAVPSKETDGLVEAFKSFSV